jgi:cell division protein FtsZ
MVLVPGHASGSTCQPLSFAEMIRTINEQVANAVSSLASIIVQPGAFELDMGDVGRVLAKSGYAAVGFGRGSGPYAAVEAVRAACSSSLLDVQQLAASQSVLLHLAAGDGVSTSEIEQAAALFSRLSAAGDFVFGVVTRPELSDAAEATVICSGFAADDLPGLEASETQTDLEPARDPDAFYYDGQNIDIPTFLRRSRMGRSVAAVV